MDEEYKTRYFNKIEYVEDKNLLKKSSTNIEKIKAEYDYYYNLPVNIQKYFVQPINFEINGSFASYYIQKIDADDLAKTFVNNNLSEDIFINVIESIKVFQMESKNILMSKSEMLLENKEIVIGKVSDRLDLLARNNEWHNSEYRLALLKNNLNIDDLFSRLSHAFEDNVLNRKTLFKKISHGDLCFSNILWDDKNKLIKLIDPKGYPFIVMDQYYDISKLSHSILGKYDDIVYEKYYLDGIKIKFDESNTNRLKNIFNEYLLNDTIDYRYLRVMEASIFLSMLPNHVEDKKRVMAFIINCDRILREIGY
jgi:hypothetical protein